MLIVIPIVNVFYEAFARGPAAYWDALVGDPDTLSAIRLTLFVAPIAVVMNVVFGVAAAWAIARFRFPGRGAADRVDRPAVRRVAGGRRPRSSC